MRNSKKVGVGPATECDCTFLQPVTQLNQSAFTTGAECFRFPGKRAPLKTVVGELFENSGFQVCPAAHMAVKHLTGSSELRGMDQ